MKITTPHSFMTNLGFTLLKLIIHLPSRLQQHIGSTIGSFAFQFATRWRRTAIINIANAFPELSKAKQERLIKLNFRSLGIALIEMALAWWGNEDKLRKNVTVSGMEHIDHALDKGNGIILLSAHFTTLEIGGKLFSLFRPLHAMYKQQNNVTFNRIMVTGRNSFLKSLIKRTDLRGMLRVLKNNQIIWYAMDQDSSGKNSLFVDFFNIKCSSTTATSKLAKASGASVIPFSTYRIEPEGRYELVIHPPLANLPSNDLQSDTNKLWITLSNRYGKPPNNTYGSIDASRISLTDTQSSTEI